MSKSQFTHITGTEVEYDVYDPTGGLDRQAILNAMTSRLGRRLGFASAGSLRGTNGCRAYSEIANKVEYGGPEVTNGRDAARFEVAGSLYWTLVALEADRIHGRPGTFWVVKTNTSRQAASSGGCHLNISMPLDGRKFREALTETAIYLKPLVACLQLITGTGLVLPARFPGARLAYANYSYAISPRAFHVVKDIGSAHTSTEQGNKPMFMDRDEALADTDLFWRLQIAALDSSLLPEMIQFRADILLLFAEMTRLRAFKPLELTDDPALGHVMRRVSLDWRTALQTNRGPKTPLEILQYYRAQAGHYVKNRQRGRSQWLLAQWDEYLAALDTPSDLPLGLYGRADWVTKAVLLRRRDSKVQRLTGKPASYTDVEDYHFRYHSFRFNAAYQRHPRLCVPFQLMRQFGPPGLIREAWHSLKYPPTDTRAWARGRFVAARPVRGTADWFAVKVEGLETVRLLDPSVPTTAAFEALMKRIGAGP